MRNIIIRVMDREITRTCTSANVHRNKLHTACIIIIIIHDNNILTRYIIIIIIIVIITMIPFYTVARRYNIM